MLQMPFLSLPHYPGERNEEPYPFPHIWINGRQLSIGKILQEQVSPLSAFEAETFFFIREWLRGTERFEVTTSGSTGKPKPISISRAQMIHSARLTAKVLQLDGDTTALVCIDPKYIGGKMMLVRCLTLGFKIMAIDPTANPLAKIPVDRCVQFTAFVPYQVQTVLESKHPHLLNNLDKVLIGGAPLNSASREKLAHFQCKCYETYGMTETISHIALRLINTTMKQPYFETMPGIQISQDDRGCLVITGDFLPGTVVTNDIVEIVEPGVFQWLGRWDTVINTGGVKVIPEKVEQLLGEIFNRYHFNHRFFIAALPDERLGNKVVLIIEGVQFSSEILQQSLDELKSMVSTYELPKEIYSTPDFSETATRKINRVQTLAGATFFSSLK